VSSRLIPLRRDSFTILARHLTKLFSQVGRLSPDHLHLKLAPLYQVDFLLYFSCLRSLRLSAPSTCLFFPFMSPSGHKPPGRTRLLALPSSAPPPSERFGCTAHRLPPPPPSGVQGFSHKQFDRPTSIGPTRLMPPPIPQDSRPSL